MAAQPKLDRLKSQLAVSKVKHEDFPLFQVVVQLIDAIRQLQLATGEEIESISGGISSLSNLRLLTHTSESVALPNSRQLIAGTNITFDDTVINQRTVNVSVPIPPDREWSVLTDGNLIEPELIFVSGDVIMVHVP